MIINKIRLLTCGIVQFAIYGSGRLFKKSARQTDTIPPYR